MTVENKNIQEVKEQVENFIQRFYELEVIMSPQSREIPLKSGGVFSDTLANAITEYQYNKDNQQCLLECISLINKAYSHGLLQSGSDLLKRLTECKKKVSELLKDLATCIANYNTLQKEHERLVRVLEQNQELSSGQQSEPNE
jgi:hemoglobin-like flavoprotein